MRSSTTKTSVSDNKFLLIMQSFLDLVRAFAALLFLFTEPARLQSYLSYVMQVDKSPRAGYRSVEFISRTMIPKTFLK